MANKLKKAQPVAVVEEQSAFGGIICDAELLRDVLELTFDDGKAPSKSSGLKATKPHAVLIRPKL